MKALVPPLVPNLVSPLESPDTGIVPDILEQEVARQALEVCDGGEYWNLLRLRVLMACLSVFYHNIRISTSVLFLLRI